MLSRDIIEKNFIPNDQRENGIFIMNDILTFSSSLYTSKNIYMPVTCIYKLHSSLISLTLKVIIYFLKFWMDYA